MLNKITELKINKNINYIFDAFEKTNLKDYDEIEKNIFSKNCIIDNSIFLTHKIVNKKFESLANKNKFYSKNLQIDTYIKYIDIISNKRNLKMMNYKIAYFDESTIYNSDFEIFADRIATICLLIAEHVDVNLFISQDNSNNLVIEFSSHFNDTFEEAHDSIYNLIYQFRLFTSYFPYHLNGGVKARDCKDEFRLTATIPINYITLPSDYLALLNKIG